MLVRLTLAFVAGLLLGAYVPYLPTTVLVCLTLLLVGLTVAERTRLMSRQQGCLGFAAVLTGVVYALLFTGPVAGDADLLRYANVPATVSGRIVEPVRHGHGRLTVVLHVHEVTAGSTVTPVSGRMRLTWRSPDRDLHYGDLLTATVRLQPPGGMVNPGGFDYAAYLERHGIEAVASVSCSGDVTVTRDPTAPWLARGWALVDHWRNRLRAAVQASLTETARGLYLGMIIGEVDDVPTDVRDAFMATGTVHLLSISGSHLGLIALLIFLAIRTAIRGLPSDWSLWLSLRVTRTRLAAVTTIPFLIFYTLLAGAQVATVRSLIMIVLFLATVWLGRENKVSATLAMAALVLLIADPRALFDISFQLSFVSVLAIVLVARHINEGDRPLPADVQARITRWLTESVRVTLGVTVATTPLVAFYFHQTAWLGLLGNLLVVPLAGFVFVPRYAFMVVLVVILSTWAWSPRSLDGRTVRVTFLDVGQGDASVIELPDGEVVLIDGGASYETLDMGRAVVAPYLWDRGIRALDHVIATHPQLDHVGGLATIVEKFPIGRYWSNGVERVEPFYRRLKASLTDHHVITGTVSEGDVLIARSGCRLQVLNPGTPREGGVRRVSTTQGTALNNDSIVARLECGPHSFLFPADIEAPVIDRLHRTNGAFAARILKAPHHGARSSLDAAWLRDSKAQVAIISAGRSNPYGHPAPTVLTAYESAHIPVLRTDRDGAITVQADLVTGDVQVARAQDTKLRRVRLATALTAERKNLRTLWRQWVTRTPLDNPPRRPVLQSS